MTQSPQLIHETLFPFVNYLRISQALLFAYLVNVPKIENLLEIPDKFNCWGENRLMTGLFSTYPGKRSCRGFNCTIQMECSTKSPSNF